MFCSSMNNSREFMRFEFFLYFVEDKHHSTEKGLRIKVKTYRNSTTVRMK